MSVKIFHNPRCSKSRKTLELLAENGVEPTIVEYLLNTPTVDELADVSAKLGMEPQQMIRFKEAAAAELGIAASDNRSPSEWLGLIAANPTLLERPIVVSGDRAVIGRPPENVLQLLAE
jgi:arsenate reductase (glutaredoxin)